MSGLARRLAGRGTPWQHSGRGLAGLQGLRWPQRTVHPPFHLETVMQIKCGLCQVPGMPLPFSSPSPPPPSLLPTSTSSLQIPLYPGASLIPKTAPQVRERPGTVAPRDRWTQSNLNLLWRAHGSVNYTPNSPKSWKQPRCWKAEPSSILTPMPENWHPEFRDVSASPPAYCPQIPA